MNRFILLIISILAYYVCYKIGYKTANIDFTKVQEERVFNLYGEGDLGEEINYYLQTGDTCLENY
jgi:hypothetical protein